MQRVGSYPRFNQGVDVSLIGKDEDRLKELSEEGEEWQGVVLTLSYGVERTRTLTCIAIAQSSRNWKARSSRRASWARPSRERGFNK